MLSVRDGSVALWALAALVLCLACLEPAPDPQPPNIVLIISDDHGWTDYGFLGHDVVQTPALDRLASQSMLYPRGYVPTPVCRPSLATLATGLYPHQHLITGNDPPGAWPAIARDAAARAEMEAVFAQSPNVAELLARSGYVSHQSGKWWEGDPLNHGFTAAMTHGDVSRRGRHGDEGLTIGREGLQPIFDFIESADGKPFFLWYAPFLPHTPHNPPERILQNYQSPERADRVAAYFAMVEWLDETVGELCDYLDGSGLADNTLVIYLADNGWLTAVEQEDQPGMRAKMSPFEMGVRTPFMIRWPGRVPPGRDDGTLVSSVDVVPTILDAAGLEPQAELPGLSLLDGDALRSREHVFGATFAHTSVDLHDAVANLKYRTVVRQDGWKLIQPYRPNRDVTLMIRGTIADWMHLEAELYQLHEDPHETVDLAGERADLVAELERSLQEWWPVPN